MYNLRQQNTTGYIINILMLSSIDGITPVTGISPNIVLSKNGSNFVLASGTISEISYGWYKYSPTSDDLNTLGELIIRASGLNADIYESRYTIVPFNPFDAVRLGLTSLPNAVAGQVNGLGINNLTIDGSVNDGSPTATGFNFNSSLSSTDDFYNGSALVFTSGTLKGIARKIEDYTGSIRRGIFTTTSFPQAPANGDPFIIIGRIE